MLYACMPSAAVGAACRCREDETRPAVCLEYTACRQEQQPKLGREAGLEHDRGQRSCVFELDEIGLNTIESCPKPCLAC